MLLAVSTIAMLSYVSTSLQFTEEELEHLPIYFRPIEERYKRLEKLNKCTIIWTIIDVELEERDIEKEFCSDDTIHTFINWNNGGIYEVLSSKQPKEFEICDWWAHSSNTTLPNIWEKIDYLITLVDNSYVDGSYIYREPLSSQKNWEWAYEIRWGLYSLTWDFPPCEPNVPKEEELKIRKKGLNSYLPELYAEKPRTAKKLFSTLEDLDLSILPQETNVLVLYAREILKMLVESL